VNVLDFGMDPKTSVDQPNTRGPVYGMSLTGKTSPEYDNEAVGQGDFPGAVLDGVRGRGQGVKGGGQPDQVGHWAGIRNDPAAQTLGGGVNSRLNGLVEGY